jgi:hypothetical protein
MMTSSSDFRGDHEWFADEFSHYWVNGFCLTFIAGKPAEVVKDTLDSSVGATLIDAGEADQLFVASLYDAGNGSIMLERGGYAGYTNRIADMLARDTRIAVVVHFLIGSPKFAYVENGALVCGFHIMDPDSRGGSSPDSLLSEMAAAGLFPMDYPDWEEEEDLEPEEGAGNEDAYRVLQAISIAARLTGIPFTSQILESSRHFLSLADFHMSDSTTTRFVF